MKLDRRSLFGGLLASVFVRPAMAAKNAVSPILMRYTGKTKFDDAFAYCPYIPLTMHWMDKGVPRSKVMEFKTRHVDQYLVRDKAPD